MVDSLLEIITERRSQKFYKPIDFHSVTNAIDEIVVSIIFLVVTCCFGKVVNQLKRERLFLIK